MTPHEITIRIDATYHPTVSPGDTVVRGQKVCADPSAQTSPVAGTIETIGFDPDRHEFVIVVVSG